MGIQRGDSNVQVDGGFLNDCCTRLLLLSVECNRHGYSDLEHYLDEAGLAVAKAIDEISRLSALSQEEIADITARHGWGAH